MSQQPPQQNQESPEEHRVNSNANDFFHMFQRGFRDIFNNAFQWATSYQTWHAALRKLDAEKKRLGDALVSDMESILNGDESSNSDSPFDKITDLVEAGSTIANALEATKFIGNFAMKVINYAREKHFLNKRYNDLASAYRSHVILSWVKSYCDQKKTDIKGSDTTAQLDSFGKIIEPLVNEMAYFLSLTYFFVLQNTASSYRPLLKMLREQIINYLPIPKNNQFPARLSGDPLYSFKLGCLSTENSFGAQVNFPTLQLQLSHRSIRSKVPSLRRIIGKRYTIFFGNYDMGKILKYAPRIRKNNNGTYYLDVMQVSAAFISERVRVYPPLAVLDPAGIHDFPSDENYAAHKTFHGKIPVVRGVFKDDPDATHKPTPMDAYNLMRSLPVRSDRCTALNTKFSLFEREYDSLRQARMGAAGGNGGGATNPPGSNNGGGGGGGGGAKVADVMGEAKAAGERAVAGLPSPEETKSAADQEETKTNTLSSSP